MKFLLLCSCLMVEVALAANAQPPMIMKQRPRQFYRTLSPLQINSTSAVHTQTLVTNRINQLALTMESILSRFRESETNILFAPINIVKTLSTVMLGTSGQTETELANALKLLLGQPLNKVIPEFHRAMGTLLAKVTTENPGVKINNGSELDIAGGVFVQNDHPIQPSFEQQARQIYNTNTYRLDFVRDAYNSARFINEWVSNKTHGRITEVVNPPVNPLTTVIIVGVLFFNGDWERPFMEKITKWQPFYLTSDGKYGKESVLAELMVNQGKVQYYENKNKAFQSIGIPYKNRNVIMYVVLPKLKRPLRDLLCNLTPEDLDTIVTKSSTTEVFYVIPKMKLNFQTNLREMLQKLNVQTLFNPQTANFSKLSEGVYASDILHKVDMDINERGTTAAAATTVSVNRGGYVNFRADRPFFFFIYNVKVGIMTFWGTIQKPTPFKPNYPSDTSDS